MIEVKHIIKQYPDKRALDDVSATFNVHETTVILGPSGSGKSTLLRTLNLLERPTSGTLALNDLAINFEAPIAKKEIFNVRQTFGMVFQEKALFAHLTVLKNIIEGPVQVKKEPIAVATKKAQALLERFGMAELAERYPSELSGGQQQRVAIMRALAMQPEYLLLDEPTSALDPELEAQVLHVLKELATQRTSMIVVTHNLGFARQVADYIIFIENGQIGYDGSAEGFFSATDNRIQQFLNAMNF
ncbi:amino acid ABC transporter ATP-binding protein [Leuconostoc pseudomesenteroides]|uniref:amino acid ABC transporter ATP-binding protein n=1 Tax=Leuconostoc pseudomesenteroides TaxID=33968 RepID=UPI00111CEF86|nr:amino acid ABC transporter ATP-binding protein [Leuconostoc pseudomesenteroides]TOZ06358.1 arginine ABC transporter ATP-binding protein ArtP [Leuconostoc pseudomesenteroides]